MIDIAHCSAFSSLRCSNFILMVCTERYDGHVGGIAQKNTLLVPLFDPAGVCD